MTAIDFNIYAGIFKLLEIKKLLHSPANRLTGFPQIERLNCRYFNN
jgi:hypothetical protein